MKKYDFNSTKKRDDITFKIEEGRLFSDFESHSHNFFEIVFIISGTAIQEINGHSYSISKGDVFVLKENMVHNFKNVDNLVLYNLMFLRKDLLNIGDYKLLPGFWALFINQPHFNNNDCICMNDEDFSYCYDIFLNIKKESDFKNTGYQTLCQLYIHQLIVLLSRLYGKDKKLNKKTHFYLGKAMSYIEEYFTQSISIEHLAEISNLSARHFTRIFKEVFEKTPVEYIVDMRIAYAKELLSTTTKCITEIAYICGFNDSNYFSRVFKQKTGVNPKLWIKN